MRLVAISGKRRSGKSTLGDILRDEYGYHPISLAEPLKHMAQTHFGLTRGQTDGIFKEQPTQYRDLSLPGRGRFLTPRDIMINMGQFYRSIDPDFWLKKLFNQIEHVPQAQMQTYVVTDVRFRNELEWMKRHKAIAVRLERSEELTGKYIQDPSETDLDSYDQWDIKIPANQNVELADLVRIAELINTHVSART